MELRTSLLCAMSGLLLAACTTRAARAPLDPAPYETPAGETLAFGVASGSLQSYFLRQGPVALHLLTRSGSRPRILFAFPAQNQGIGLWFAPASDDTLLWAGPDQGPASASNAGGLGAVRRPGGGSARVAYGARATLHSNASQLTLELGLLANVRTLRDYASGVCLEEAERFPELRNESIALDAERNLLRMKREQIGGDHALELTLQGKGETRLALRAGELPARPGCAATTRTLIDIQSPDAIELAVVALSDEEPLTPLETGELLTGPASDETALAALGFLSYAEKLEAGSWRFLTYFGRDTLLALELLLPVLQPRVLEAGLGSVLERINLDPAATDPTFGAIELGEVAHEESIGDYAAWLGQQRLGARAQSSRTTPPSADLRAPRLDYKMVDDDFLLAPVLWRWLARVDGAGNGAGAEALLSRTRADGRSYRDALLANLALVLERARPFAEDPATAADKKQKLVALKPDVSVGQWRDSNQGIAFGRYAFDVNAALVPGALAAASALYRRLGNSAEAARAERYLAAWRGVEALFRIELPLDEARANVAAFAAAAGVADPAASLAADASSADGAGYSYYGIALDGAGTALPVQHSDHGFVMAFTEPSDEYLIRAATTLAHPFPAGLVSPVGVLVATPALAPADYSVIDPKDLRSAGDDERVLLRDVLTPADYHGTVVWSWQQALLASGLRRQLERPELSAAARGALSALECRLWRVIEATKSVRSAELWSYRPGPDGQPEYRAFGDAHGDADESNAIQLWSTVYLAVAPPAREQNACGAALTAP
jgi:hypothetical protein